MSTPSATQAIHANAETYRPYLEISHPFTVRDIDKDDAAQELARLKELSIVEVVDTVTVPTDTGRESKTRTIKRYRWKPQYLSTLADAIDRESVLPCGHRPHILNTSYHNGYSCRYCREDPDNPVLPAIEPHYTKETIKERL